MNKLSALSAAVALSALIMASHGYIDYREKLANIEQHNQPLAWYQGGR